MPTERFYRLPAEKSDVIRQAAIAEFSRVCPEEASINRIIRDADISRGSFYTYFEDKYDLLNWLMKDASQEFFKFYIVELQQNGGDIWDVFERSLGNSVRWIRECEIVEIFGNIIRNSAFDEIFQKRIQTDPEKAQAETSYIQWLHRHTDPKVCSLDLETFRSLHELHLMTLVISLKQIFGDQKSVEAVEPGYRRKMRLLRFGAAGQE